ncbi:MAG TPA: hypothetical protein VM618_05480, partial [Acidimicrobiia bacterium]|nr:hypothetical protein [Acidimicrobiia bacterium]
GAEPLVILSYMPPWLADHHGAFDPRDPTKIRPSDLDAWESLVREVVTTLATAAAPALRFEVWNEPDLPIFWQDSPDAFYAMALRTHAAVARVAFDTGLPLEVGGPATAFPDPAFMLPYLGAVRDAGLPLDFVSWHYYGNHPFLGPDGAEGIIPEPVLPAHPVIGRRNPVTTPGVYRTQVESVRAWTDAALAGSGLDPELVIDEWNVSAGGFDQRHDTDEGAAFAAGVLTEMEAAGLDAADFYRASDDPSLGPGRRGDWGLVDTEGRPKPSWWVFDAWRVTSEGPDGAASRLPTSLRLGGVVSAMRTEVPQDGNGAAGLFARATRRGGDGAATVDVLLANFEANGGVDHTVDVRVDGAECAPRAVVRLLDGPDGDFDHARPLDALGGQLTLDLPPQSVAWVSFHACR